MGHFRHKETGSEIEAEQHDGTDERGLAITRWINENGGTAHFYAKGSIDFDLHNAYVSVKREAGFGLEVETLRPGFWVVRVENHFFVVFGEDFNSLYEPVKTSKVDHA